MIFEGIHKLFFIKVIEFCESSTDKIGKSLPFEKEFLLPYIIPNSIVFLVLNGIIESSNLSPFYYSQFKIVCFSFLLNVLTS